MQLERLAALRDAHKLFGEAIACKAQGYLDDKRKERAWHLKREQLAAEMAEVAGTVNDYCGFTAE